jgi:hypothetical protein
MASGASRLHSSKLLLAGARSELRPRCCISCAALDLGRNGRPITWQLIGRLPHSDPHMNAVAARCQCYVDETFFTVDVHHFVP